MYIFVALFTYFNKMKKVLFLTLSVLTLAIISCSKENKVNRKIDGNWSVKTINDVAPGNGDISGFEFVKEKSGKGRFYIYTTDGFGGAGTYDLEKDDKLIAYIGQDKLDTFQFAIKDYSNKALTLEWTSEESTFKLEKK